MMQQVMRGVPMGAKQPMRRRTETHPEAYRRIEAVAKVDGVLRVLDLTDAAVRKAVVEAVDAASLYMGALANDY